MLNGGFMNERTGLITMKGNGLTLLGDAVTLGNPAPDFTILDQELQPVDQSILKDKVTILVTVPSVDTPVCDTEVRRFSEEAKKLDPAIQIVTISMDLPFAQQRWCVASSVDNVKVYSDFNGASFGTNYGVLIKEIRLLARAIFIVDKSGKIQYQQLVPEVTDEPDYGAVLMAAKELARA